MRRVIVSLVSVCLVIVPVGGCSSRHVGVTSPHPTLSTPSKRSQTSSTTVTSTVETSKATARQSAPCLTASQALAMVALHHSPTIILDEVHGYACVGGWAYVNFHYPPPHANHATVDLQYVHGSWIIADRLLACGTPRLVPPAIYAYGCGN